MAYDRILVRIRQTLLISEDAVNILVAVLLLLSGVGVLYLTLIDISHGISSHLVMNLIHNALLVLIVKEVLWTVIKFLGRKEFSIISFFHIGLISAVRHLLFVEANMGHSSEDKVMLLAEFLITALVIFLVSIGYFVVKKSETPHVTGGKNL